jgi:hypothetical protein
MNEPQVHRTSRRRSREEADRLVMEYEQSGLTRRAFCHRHGLSTATLDNYRITNGKVHDVSVLNEIALEAGAFYVMDRGYIYFERIYSFTLESAFFVMRSKLMFCRISVIRAQSILP